MKRRFLLLASIALLGLTGRTSAQDPEYVENLRFVHELRQRGDTDLALDLLQRLDKNASPQLKRELSFEIALCRKAEAVNEPDSRKRLDLYAQARTELIKFRDANPTSPRLADVKIDIADITVQEGKTQMSRAMALEGVPAQSTGLLEARTKFEAAAVELKAITEELDGKFAALGDPKTPAERTARAALEKTRLRAELSVALNQFDIAQTYHRESSKTDVLIERGSKVTKAAKDLQKVASREDTYSEAWQARAWLGRCEHELGNPPKTVRERFIPIIDSRNPAAADGARLAKYFRFLVIQECVGGANAEPGEDYKYLIDGGRRWLRDYPRAHATPEGNGVRFLLADSLMKEARGDPKLPQVQKKQYLEEARKLLSALAESENEFSDRARYMEISLIGLEGGFSKPVNQLDTFNQCYVRAQYEIMEMIEDSKKVTDPKELETKRTARVETILTALKRGLEKPDGIAKGGLKVNNARSMLAYYYLYSRKYPEAIRVGKQFVKESNSGPAALAAAYTLQSYGASIAEREANLQKASSFTDDDGHKIDEAAYRKVLTDERADMLAFAEECQKRWPKELAGNLARHQLGLMYLRNPEKIADGFKYLNSITPEYPSYTAIQLLIANESFKADANSVPPFADPAKGEKAPVPFRERGLAALRNIPEPINPDPDQYRSYFQAKTQLGFELYRFKKFADMEALVQPLLQKVGTITFHPKEETNTQVRDYYRGQLTKVQLLAKVGQADESFKANDFKKVAALVDPMLTSLKDPKTAVMPQLKTDPQLAQAVQVLMALALQANVQLGDLEKVRLIVSVYGKAIGEDPTAVTVPEILRRLVPLLRVQVKALNAQPDVKKRDAAVKEFAAILDDLKKQQPKPSGAFLIVLAECYGSLDQIGKSIELLQQVPDPDGELTLLRDKKKTLEEQLQKAAVAAERDRLQTEIKKATEEIEKKEKEPPDGRRIFQSSRLVYLRQLRQQAESDSKLKAENIKKASALLNEWMGTKEKPGWAMKSIDAHKERLELYKLEDDTGRGFNKAQDLVKMLSARVNDKLRQEDAAAARPHYLDCYFHMVYFLYMHGKKATSTSERDQEIAQAASRIVALEAQYKDFPAELVTESKRKFSDLMTAEKRLKIEYEKMKQK